APSTSALITSWSTRLRAAKPAPIERPKSGCASACPVPGTAGVSMRLIGWAIALAAAGLTPAAAEAQAGSSTQNALAADAATPPAGTAQNPGKPDTAQPPTVVPGSI